MEPVNGGTLQRDTINICLELLLHYQAIEDLKGEEKGALGALLDWLGHIDSHLDSDDESLDESARAYLASYRDKPHKTTVVQASRPKGGALGELAKAATAWTKIAQSNPVLAKELDLLQQVLIEEGVPGKLDDWEAFDVFKVERLSNKRPLQAVALAILERYDLIDKLDLPVVKLKSFLREVEASYNANPYHNSTHAADVTQSLAAILAADSLVAQITDLELLAMILAACVHDVGHPGVTNDFLIHTHSPAAILYNDNSVNENMHVSTAFRILRSSNNNFLAHFSEDEYRFVRRLIIQIVLATDMACHTELVKECAAHQKLLGSDLEHWGADKRCCLLRMVVHCADLANPAKPLNFSQQWTRRIAEEYFIQGDKEREAGLPLSPLCDRKVLIPKSQLTFLEYVVQPSYEVLRGMAPNAASRALQHIEAGKTYWRECLGQQQLHGGAAFNGADWLPAAAATDGSPVPKIQPLVSSKQCELGGKP